MVQVPHVYVFIVLSPFSSKITTCLLIPNILLEAIRSILWTVNQPLEVNSHNIQICAIEAVVLIERSQIYLLAGVCIRCQDLSELISVLAYNSQLTQDILVSLCRQPKTSLNFIQNPPSKPQEALNLLLRDESYSTHVYMPLYAFIRNLLNVLMQIANKKGLQTNIYKVRVFSKAIVTCGHWRLCLRLFLNMFPSLKGPSQIKNDTTLATVGATTGRLCLKY